MITWNQLWKTEKNYSSFKKMFKKSRFFKDFETPVSKNNILPFDRKNFFNYMIYIIGDLEPFTADPYIAFKAVHAWTVTRLPYWQRMLNALDTEYEPLWNYNRWDEENEKENQDVNQNSQQTEEIKENENYAGDVHQDTVGYDTNTTKTAGFDSGDLVMDKYDDQTHNGYLNEYDQYGSGHDTDRNNNEDMTRNENNNRDLFRHAYGNIGTMSTQDLIKQEIEIAQISIYNTIIDEFKEQFCLLVY